MKDVIELLAKFSSANNNILKQTFIDEIEIAISALEKQTPKKPIKELNETICPNCKTLVGSSPFCRYCGQALDWSD